MLPTYLQHLESEGRSAGYVAKQRRVLTRLLPDPQGELDRLSLRATETTLRDHVNRLKCYGAWLERSGQENPFTDVSAPVARKVSQDKATISKGEVDKLVSCEAVPERRRALWLILAVTGLRPVEAQRTRPEHLRRRAGRWELALPGELQKSGRADVIGLTAKEAGLIRKHCPLVPGSVDKLSRLFHRDLRAAGIPVKQHGVNRTPYNLRSYCITRMLQAGADLETVRLVARHADPLTTLRHYARHKEGVAAAARQEILKH